MARRSERFGLMALNENESNDGYKFMVSGDSISKGVIFDEVKSKYVIF